MAMTGLTGAIWMTLVGSATYEGRAVGVHTGPTRIVYFEAKARLTANFGSEIPNSDLPRKERFSISLAEGGASFSWGAGRTDWNGTGLFGNSAAFYGEHNPQRWQ